VIEKQSVQSTLRYNENFEKFSDRILKKKNRNTPYGTARRNAVVRCIYDSAIIKKELDYVNQHFSDISFRGICLATTENGKISWQSRKSEGVKNSPSFMAFTRNNNEN
jgi:hypothetical protein